jgi:hypothetical protein
MIIIGIINVKLYSDFKNAHFFFLVENGSITKWTIRIYEKQRNF